MGHPVGDGLLMAVADWLRTCVREAGTVARLDGNELDLKQVVAFEALLRWHHPVRGVVSPMDFIYVAGETGLILAIGEWVLRTACFEAENWPPGIIISVTISPVQFKQGDLVAVVQTALQIPAALGLQGVLDHGAGRPRDHSAADDQRQNIGVR